MCICICWPVSPSGSINYSEVTALLRKQSVLSGMYMSMTTSLNTTVSMTANHLIYARKHCSEKFHPVYVIASIFYEINNLLNNKIRKIFLFQNFRFPLFYNTVHIFLIFLGKQLLIFGKTIFRYAKKIVLGDEVLVQNNDKMNPTKIIKISMFVNQGMHWGSGKLSTTNQMLIMWTILHFSC